jgi:sec-independent protein translocase protein TatB
VFDIGFTELLLCLVVALVVIGPEQLPGAVRSISLWIGRLKRSLRDTRAEIERQIGADDIRRQLHNEEIMQHIEETKKAMQKTIDDSTHWIEHQELPDHAHTEATQQTKDTSNPTLDAPVTHLPSKDQ